MANDPPTNLRMGFGFTQARAAGAPYVRPRSGYLMDWDIKERSYKAALNVLVKEDTSIGKLVQAKMEIMKGGVVWIGNSWCFQLDQEDRYSATYLYYFVLYDRPELAPKGYWNDIQGKYGWPVPPQSK